MPAKIKVGLIGGTGLDSPDILKNRTEKQVTTNFGDPSDVLIEGDIEDIPCALLSRHGSKHTTNPSNINYRANVWALKEAGCTHIIVTNATGSLIEEFKPGDIVIMDNFIDRTYARLQTFYDGKEGSPPGLLHLPVEPPFCVPLRDLICEAADELELEHHKSGVIVVVEGPRFSSLAESKMHQQMGGQLVGMTTVPEVCLAKEAGLLYASIAVVTDYDCWHEGDMVNHQSVLDMFAQTAPKVQELIKASVKKIAEREWDEEIDALNKLLHPDAPGGKTKPCGCAKK